MLEQRIRNNVEVREVKGSDGRQFVIRSLPYLVVDTFNTRFRSGVFNKGYETEGLPTFLFGHVWTDMQQVLGHAVDYSESKTGRGALQHVMELSSFEDVPGARQASAQLRDGTFRRFSVGFERLAEAEPEDAKLQERGVVDITEGINEEVSVVIAASVPGTKLISQRGKTLIPDLAELLRRGIVSESRAKLLLEEAFGELAAPVLEETVELAEQTPPEESRSALAVDAALVTNVAALFQAGAMDAEQARATLVAAARPVETPEELPLAPIEPTEQPGLVPVPPGPPETPEAPPLDPGTDPLEPVDPGPPVQPVELEPADDGSHAALALATIDTALAGG